MLKELNDRLDRKAYENAKLYYRMEDYKASRVAFKNILKDDAENIYREEILYLHRQVLLQVCFHQCGGQAEGALPDVRG